MEPTPLIQIGPAPVNRIDEPYDPVKLLLETQALANKCHKIQFQEMKDAAEMLWVVLANVSGGDWKKQDKTWQEAARRWADNYHDVCKKYSLKTA